MTSKRRIIGLLLALLATFSFSCIPSQMGSATSDSKTPATANEESGNAPLTADQIIDRHIAAIGGVQAISRIVSCQASGTFEGPESNITGTVMIYFKSPGKGALVMKTSDGSIAIARVFDGSRGLTRTVNRQTGRVLNREMSQSELERLRISADFISSPLKYKAIYRSRSLRGKEQLEERDVYVIDAVDPFGDREVMYFDVKTGLLVRDDHSEEISDRGKKRAQSYAEDYREIPGASGVKSAYTISTFYPDASDLNSIVRFSDCKVNLPLDDSLFAIPRN